jgi:hypothetical protein
MFTMIMTHHSDNGTEVTLKEVRTHSINNALKTNYVLSRRKKKTLVTIKNMIQIFFKM